MSTCKDFTGKVVLITGSSSGIGEEIALYLSSLGAEVVITGRDINRINIVAEKCRQLSNRRVLEVVADLQLLEDIKKLVDQTIDEFGKIDVLVNNAGITRLTSILDPNIMQSYEEIFNTNVKGVLFLTHLLVPHLEKSKGNIIDVSSIASIRPMENVMTYCMAKSSLDMFTKCLAIELGPKGIRVNSINPAVVRTPIFETVGIPGLSIDSVEKTFADSYPLGRIGEPIDCAKAVAYLASDDASFISGIQMPVDGASLYANLKKT